MLRAPVTFATFSLRPFVSLRASSASQRFLCTAAPSHRPVPSPLAIIGAGGNMATALIRGLTSHPSSPEIRASSPSLDHLSHLPLAQSAFYTSNLDACRDAALIVLSVKPQIAPHVLRELAPLYKAPSPPILLSFVAGLSTSRIASLLNSKAPIVRTLPNIAATHQASTTAICGADHTTQADVSAAKSVMQAVGTVVQLPEHQFGAFTAVSGAGVAYVFMVAEALADAAVAHGLGRKVAMEVAAETIFGAGSCLKGGEHAAVLRNSVESPGGVTIAGTGSLERGGLRGLFLDAVEAAVERNQEFELGE